MITPAEQGIQVAKHDALPWKYSDRGMFRSLPEVSTIHNGKPVWMEESEEYIDGRWEGFVSIRKRVEN